MHDSDLHHEGKEEIARLPTVRQGIILEDDYLPRKRKRKNKAHAYAPESRILRFYLVGIERTVTLSTSDNEDNKITPLYIMSKNRGNCSVNLKKNIKIFLNVQIAVYPHLGITRITLYKPLIYKARARFCNGMATDYTVSPSINPCSTRDCGVFQ